MKKTVFSLLIAIGILLGVTAFAHKGEYIPEGVDAPYGLAKTILPDGCFDGQSPQWRVGNPGKEGAGTSTYSVTDTGDLSGNGGYWIWNILDDGTLINACQVSVDTESGELKASETYVFSFWVKTDKIDKYKINSVWLRSTEENKSIADVRHEIELICDGEWHYYAVPFVIQKDADKARLMIQFGGQGKQNFKLMVDEIKLRPISKVPPMELPELSQQNFPLFEDISGHWAENEINEMASLGIINGRSETQFDPEAAVTRAEISAILVRALGFRPATTKNPYKDCDHTAWYGPSLDIISEAGVIDDNMLWNGFFYPHEELRREELAMFLANSYDKMLDTVSGDCAIYKFKDRKEISDWAIIYIMRCIRNEFMKGVTWDYFQPQSTVTRAQAATSVYRLRKVLEVEFQ